MPCRRLLPPVVLLAAMLGLASGSAPQPPPTAATDLRPEFQRFGFGPRQQGGRPTCSAFTVTTALEFATARRLGACPRLSVEFLNWAANQARGDRDDGGYFSDLWHGFSAHGLCREDAMPYQPRFDPDHRPDAAAAADARKRLDLGLALHWIKEWDITTGLTDAQFAAVKHTLDRGWPVCSGLRWPKAPRWPDGVLAMCPPDGVVDGHSVLLVGYRDDPAQPGGGTLVFRNTSGPGHDGAMPYAYARAYTNDAAWISCDRPRRGR